jgi:hypothetical protein
MKRFFSVIAILLFIWGSLFAQQDNNVTLMGRWPNGPCLATFAVGTTAYFGNGGALEIYDISNPNSPVKIGQGITPSVVRGIYVSGDYAYVADYSAGLRIIDISAPASPVEVGFLNLGGQAYDVHVVDNMAYVAYGGYGLRIIDIGTPSSPIEVGSFKTDGDALDVCIQDNYAYIADGGGGGHGLHILDISDPASPDKVGFITIPSNAYGVFVQDNYAYVAGWDGLYIVDISTPASPSRTGLWETESPARKVFVVGNNTCVADADAGLRIIDVSNPSVPAEVSFIDTGDQAYGIHVQNNNAYVADVRDGLRIVDVSNPASQTEAGFLDSGFYRIEAVFVQDNYAYVADFTTLRIIDVTSSSSPVEVGHIPTQGQIKNIRVLDSFAYVADGDYGFRIIDLSTPSSAVEAGYLSAIGHCEDVDVLGNYAYLAASGNGVQIIDITTPSSPVKVGSFDTNGNALGVCVRDNYAYVAADWKGLRIVDVSTPSSPVEVGYSSGIHSASSIDVQGDYAYVADQNRGLRIVDISRPSAPEDAGYYFTGGHAEDVYVQDGLVYVAASSAGFFILQHDAETTVLDIVGTWEVTSIEGAPPVDGSNSTWTFNADGTYQWFLLLPPFFDMSGGGNYSITGTTLTCDGTIASLYGEPSTSLVLTPSNNDNTFSMLDPDGDRWTYNRISTISVIPDALSANLAAGDQSTQNMTIANASARELNFDISVESQSYALDLDGVDDYVTISNPASFDFNSNFTWSAWIKTSNEGVILAKSPGNDVQGPKTFFVDPSGFLNFDIAFSGSVRGALRVDDDQWHHVAVSMDYNAGKLMQLYVDGVQDQSAQLEQDVISEAGFGFRIGYDGRTPDELFPFTGLIDGVRIWDKVLTLGELQTNMCLELNGDEPGLVGYWNFDETSGNTAFDLTSGGNHGSLEGEANRILSTAPLGTHVWLSFSPVSGTVPAGSSQDIEVLFDATNLSDGDQNAALVISSNDVVLSKIRVPLHLTVTTPTGIEESNSNQIPTGYSLFQNFPNPFNPRTRIRFGLPKTSDVKIELFNTHGQLVQTLIDSRLNAGHHAIDFSGSQLASGVYFYRIRAEGFMTTKKMILLK